MRRVPRAASVESMLMLWRTALPYLIVLASLGAAAWIAVTPGG